MKKARETPGLFLICEAVAAYLAGTAAGADALPSAGAAAFAAPSAPAAV